MVRTIHSALWLVNLAIGAAITTALVVLMSPAPPVALPGRDESRRPTPKPPVSPVWMLQARNPLAPATETPLQRQSISLLGTNAASESAWRFAYLLVDGRYVTAFWNEPIEGLPGWRLIGVTPSAATLSNGERVLALLVGESGDTSGTPMPRGRCTLIQRSADREVYGVDEDRIAWVRENVESVLSSLGLQDYSGGGIQITSVAQDSVIAELGLRSHDVIKSVNGRPVASMASLAEWREPHTWPLVISLERGGQVKTLVVQSVSR